MKTTRFFLSESFQFCGGKILNIFEKTCFQNVKDVEKQTIIKMINILKRKSLFSWTVW